MNDEQYVILTSWLISNNNLLNLTEAICTFLVDKTNWRIPYELDKGQKYDLVATWPLEKDPRLWAEMLDYRQGGNERARQQILERNIEGIQAQFTGYWRNPYILNQAIREGYAIDIDVKQSTHLQNAFLVKIRLDYSNLWFSPPQYGEVIWESYDFVQEDLQAGYELLKGKEFVRPSAESGSSEQGQSYIIDEQLSQENRLKVIDGIAKYLHHFLPKAAILTYYQPAQYDYHQKQVSYPKSIEFAPSMYYLSEGITISPKSLAHFEATYFTKKVEDVELHLEEDHFGFLK